MAGANSLVNRRIFKPPSSRGRCRGCQSARILDFLVIAEYARELGRRSERLDGIGDQYRVDLVGLDGIANIDEPLGERFRQIVGAPGPRHEKTADALLDVGL